MCLYIMGVLTGILLMVLGLVIAATEVAEEEKNPERRILDICCLWSQGGYTDREAMQMICALLTEETK